MTFDKKDTAFSVKIYKLRINRMFNKLNYQLMSMRSFMPVNYLSRVFLLILFVLCLMTFLVSCASRSHKTVKPPKKDYITSSWYGSKFHGRQTSSGEIYNMYAMTCAHKKFPFGTRLRVTYLKTNRSVVVTVNDRGPFIAGRDLDLSYGAAKEIGLTKEGIGRVRIEYLGRDMRYVQRIESTPSETGPFTIQVGSFSEQANAERLKQGLGNKNIKVYIAEVSVNGRKFYRVRIGSFTKKNKAYSFAKDLANEGYSVLITKQD